MNRIQFWLLISLSSLVVIFLVAQAGLAVWSERVQVRLLAAQQAIQQGRACDQRWRQLVGRVVEVSQKTQDQGLKDLLNRQGITVKVNPNPDASSGSAPPASPSPAAPAAPNP
jgi:hypothetical protein